MDESRARRWTAMAAVALAASAGVAVVVVASRPEAIRAVQVSTGDLVSPVATEAQLPAAVTTTTGPPAAAAGPAAHTGAQTAVGNRSSTVVEVPRDGGGVRISNSGTASANTGGNVVGNPPASVVTGPASATGNESSVVVGGRP